MYMHLCMYVRLYVSMYIQVRPHQYGYVVSNWIREGAVASHEKIVSAQKALKILWMISQQLDKTRYSQLIDERLHKQHGRRFF